VPQGPAVTVRLRGIALQGRAAVGQQVQLKKQEATHLDVLSRPPAGVPECEDIV
jgi:hypothetical protein